MSSVRDERGEVGSLGPAELSRDEAIESADGTSLGLDLGEATVEVAAYSFAVAEPGDVTPEAVQRCFATDDVVNAARSARNHLSRGARQPWVDGGCP